MAAEADLAAVLARRQMYAIAYLVSPPIGLPDAQPHLSVEEELVRVEKQIYYLEQSYLEDTRGMGNAIRGYDTFLTA